MPTNLKFELIALVIIMGIVILLTLRAEKITIKYAIVWLAAIFILLLILLIPNILEPISQLLGFEVLSNMVFLIGIIALYCIVFSLTIIISNQSKKIRLLIQEISILKKEVHDKLKK